MRRLLCRWVEYYLALSEDDIERGLPGWVRRHLQVCAHCQAEARVYRRTREVVRQYASLLPDAPAGGWQPLQVRGEAKQRGFPLQIALVPVAVAVVAWIGLAMWQRVSPPTDDGQTAPAVVQNVIPPHLDAAMPEKNPAAPTTIPSQKGGKPKQEPSRQPAAPEQAKPAPAPRQTPSTPVHRPPKRILIAAQPVAQNVQETLAPPVAESLPEPEVPVQPVLAEASPPSTHHIPEAFVVQPAYAAAAGGVE
ncbi:MAG: hypothetical protein KatS3mg023_0510 [Armatimonadota bacterium]|nr:MAG: hypothetical protein KatS3mg023_0510 [Armatimonadota bacterium]